ncbi:hypothetical protein HYC85_019859 [Camellia sinensis]|uniref:NB-ARC domain-containing protein n=1 Tax=Camellia sinensis TaxID=4442 RepID=A0A7J7GP21_CAMSI|nr:hypothetical protein HYC85_019859 [Camellia sinensis]
MKWEFVTAISMVRLCLHLGKKLSAKRWMQMSTFKSSSYHWRMQWLCSKQLWVTVVRTNKTIEGIAKKIAKESGGLPLAIKAMAIDLKHENYVCTWQNAVWTLQQAIDGPQQHLQEVFNIFELLYGQLHVNMRRCLLYAALFPGGYEIYKDYLVEGWKVQGLIRDVQGGNGQTFEDARIRGDYFLEHLTELSLLAKCLKEKYIKMPELVRNQAHHLYPKEEECQIVVEACTEEKEWRDAGRIALMHNRPLSLPKKPKCGKLSTLLLQRMMIWKSFQNRSSLI